MKSAPDWPLIRELCAIVYDAPGGGLHRDELTERMLSLAPPVAINDALMIAYGRKRVDFCGRYVVAPVRRQDARRE